MYIVCGCVNRYVYMAVERSVHTYAYLLTSIYLLTHTSSQCVLCVCVSACMCKCTSIYKCILQCSNTREPDLNTTKRKTNFETDSTRRQPEKARDNNKDERGSASQTRDQKIDQNVVTRKPARRYTGLKGKPTAVIIEETGIFNQGFICVTLSPSCVCEVGWECSRQSACLRVSAWLEDRSFDEEATVHSERKSISLEPVRFARLKRRLG